MTDAYVIEIAGTDVGLVVRQNGERAYRFHAATQEVDALDGDLFASPQAATRAATQHLGNRKASGGAVAR